MTSTDQTPPACHYDKHLGERVTREHTENSTCTSGCQGCKPCTEPHCSTCGRTHLDGPDNTCPDCVGVVRKDLTQIRADCRMLRREAVDAGRDGRLAAAAPIPGGTAMVLLGPAVILDQVTTRGGDPEDFGHRVDDPLPPLAVLADWEDRWRTHLDHTPGGRTTLTKALDYLDLQLSYMAQQTEGPDWTQFTRDIAGVRRALQHTLHNETEPERGVECFECGDRLIRRIHDPARCTHQTPARGRLAEQLRARAAMVDRADAARAWLLVIASYPELEGPTMAELHAARRPLLPTPVQVTEAKLPCPHCDQGGITDPSAGQSWECPGCRKEYDPGEYAHAVRRDLLDNRDGDGWTDVMLAASAASTLTGFLVPDTTVRKWMDRGLVSSCCRLTYDVVPNGDWVLQPGRRGQRLVYWPDVADRAVAAKIRKRGLTPIPSLKGA